MNTITWFDDLKPHFKRLPLQERLWCGIGAAIGLGLSALLSWLILGGINAWYIAPMGASSVLLFAVASSPLAQPWNVIVGNTLAALIGVACAKFIPDVMLAFSCAVGVSIFVMMSVDALHPPSGAIAMTAVLGGKTIQQLGFEFALYPVLLNSILLLLIAVVFNRLIGRDYPQRRQLNTRSTDPTPTQKVSIQPSDIQYALAQKTELLDISEYDLQSLILDAQQHANQRLYVGVQCKDIMTIDVVYLHEDDDILKALDVFKKLNIMSLPILNAEHQLTGTLALSDVVEWFRTSSDMRSPWQDQVGQVMHRQVVMVRPTQDVIDLVPYFVEKSFNYLPVIAQDQKLLGMISRADMIAVLYQQLQQHQLQHHQSDL